MNLPLIPKNDRGSSRDFQPLNLFEFHVFMLDDDPEEVQQKDDEDKAASVLEEGCRRVLVSTGELGIDDDQLEHSHQYADDGDEEEDLLGAAFEI